MSPVSVGFYILCMIIGGRLGALRNPDELAFRHSHSNILCFILMIQFVNDLHALISPTPQGTPLPLILLGKVKLC